MCVHSRMRREVTGGLVYRFGEHEQKSARGRELVVSRDASFVI